MFLLPLVFGCGSPVVPVPLAPEASVRPGINDPYKDPDIADWTKRFETENREIFVKRLEIVTALNLEPGQAVADVGAGTGLFTPLLAEAVGGDGVVYAVDIVPEFLEHIEKRVAEAGRENVKTVLCTEQSVGLPAQSIDLAFLCDVYHHLEYPRSSMASIRSALRPGGTVVLVDFERIPGESNDWVMNHVRAGKEAVVAEMESYGFERVEELEVMRENYVLRFRPRKRRRRPAPVSRGSRARLLARPFAWGRRAPALPATIPAFPTPLRAESLVHASSEQESSR